jgi:2,3-dihydroxybenzoate-AMP ligase
LTRGPYTLRGYYNATEYNSSAFSSDGYLRTGDLVRITRDGNLVVEGRIKNVINRGGEKVSVEEVESYLLAYPSVRKAAVIAVPDRILGERICAVVVSSGPTIKLPEIRDFFSKQGIANFKMPDRLKTVSSLPETGLGKIDRAALRQALMSDPDDRS